MPQDDYAHLLGVAPEHLNDDHCRAPAATNNRIAELTTVYAPWAEISLLLARQSGVGALGVWDYLITCASTPLEGIKDAAAYFAAVADTATDTLRVTEDGDRVTISHINHADMTHEAACAIRAYALGLYQQRLSQSAQRRLLPLHVALTAKAPRRHDSLTELFGTHAIDFEAPDSSITFLAADLKAPTPHVQPGLSTVIRRHAEQALATATPLRNWLDLFRTALSTVHTEATPTLPAVARHMAVSTRTLQRRLFEHGTTWNDELESTRRAHITRLLHNTDLSLEAIAARSGYADARSLRRAIRRWYDTTPTTLRRDGSPHHGATSS
ncbi:helix-turn-helix domain-containing protein [Streptomyces massasporeus]|uniref:helix-turn-helix domain-containing protein n=1 Tax=Streptomyces massasporeus TaxID=67324 RepID=UPI0033FEA150